MRDCTVHTTCNVSAIEAGDADLAIDFFGYGSKVLSQKADYLFPLVSNSIRIYSNKLLSNKGKIFDGIFDSYSYGFIVISYLFLAMMLALLNSR